MYKVPSPDPRNSNPRETMLGYTSKAASVGS